MSAHRVPMEEAPFDNSGTKPLSVPGIGLSIHVTLEDRFQHGIDDFHADRITVREVTMLAFMDSITDKPDWDKKVFDEAIVERWRAESNVNPMMSSKTFEWCITELRDKAKACPNPRYVKTLENGSTCVKSDTAIAPDLRTSLIRHCKPLQDALEKDWHPNSNDQVLNLVHPSLFPLVYGQSRVLREGQVGLKNCLESCGRGEVTEADQPITEENLGLGGYRQGSLTWADFWSKKFQWLPCEVRFTGETETAVKISSYINNLHPVKHESLYHVIEQFISASIPMWNEVLLKTEDEKKPPRVVTNTASFTPDWPDWVDTLPWVSDAENPETLEQVEKVRQFLDQPDREGHEEDPDAEEMEDETAEDSNTEKGSIEWAKVYGLRSAMDWKYKRVRQLKHPEPEDYESWKNGKDEVDEALRAYRAKQDTGHVKLQEDFRDKGLQVIVKLAGVELTPEKPRYEGGSWHLEGMLNEHIVATSIYYYEVENVTESHLHFRQNALLDEYDLKYEQDDHEPLAQTFGTDSMRDEPAVQEFGKIATKEGRLLVFPNTLQHRVESFELEDVTKPGHRRFLLLWLVDPHYRIVSTANVPPQRHDWWADEVLRKVVDASKLPPELSKMVEDEAADYPMSMGEAKRLRLELMEERTTFGNAVERAVEAYNLCEH